MKLCFIANANSIHTHRWVQPLIDQGHEITLISYKPVKINVSENIEIIDLSTITNIRKIRWLIWGLWIKIYLNRTKTDILHALQIQAAGWLGDLSNYQPFVVSSWGSDLLIESKRSNIRRSLVNRVLSRSKAVTVPSKLLYNTAVEHGVSTDKLRLIPWGIETNVFNPNPADGDYTKREFGIDPESKVIFSPRSISRLYNIDTIITACKGLLNEGQKITILLLRYNVDNKYMSELGKLIAHYKIEQFVHWIPPQASLENMARLYRVADVTMSIPSSEGYGFTVFEAMACGCPTVISDLPLFEDELAHGTHTLKVGVRDSENTKIALNNLLTKPSLNQHIRKQALNVVKDKTVEQRIDKTILLYNQLLFDRQHANYKPL